MITKHSCDLTYAIFGRWSVRLPEVFLRATKATSESNPLPLAGGLLFLSHLFRQFVLFSCLLSRPNPSLSSMFAGRSDLWNWTVWQHGPYTNRSEIVVKHICLWQNHRFLSVSDEWAVGISSTMH